MTIKISDKVYHADALVFNNENKILVRFEPHGGQTSMYDMQLLDEAIKSFLIRKDVISAIRKWTYKASIDYCDIGLQTKENRVYYDKKMDKVLGKQRVIECGGYCSA